jgi:hypothetical protein
LHSCSHTIDQRRAAILGVVGDCDETQDSRIKHFDYRLEVVPLTVFLVDVPVDFLVVDFAGVLVDLEVVTVRLAALAVLVDLVGAVVLLEVRNVVFVEVARGADAFGAGSAIASIRGGVRLGIAARTWRTALACCSSVVRNSWCPSVVATKYRY